MSEYTSLIGITIQTVLYLLGGYAMVIRNDAKSNSMQQEIRELKEVAKSLAVIITQQAVQTVRLDSQGERLNLIDDKIERIRRGEGLSGFPRA